MKDEADVIPLKDEADVILRGVLRPEGSTQKVDTAPASDEHQNSRPPTGNWQLTTGNSPLSSALRTPHSALPALLFLACCILPLTWILWALVTHPAAWNALQPLRFHLRLLGHTLLYNSAVALLATLLALPVAIVIGLGRGRLARLLTFAIPAALLLPSIVYTYGWMQVLRLSNEWVRDRSWLAALGVTSIYPAPASTGDVLRCIWTLATWLWPVPAGIIGLSLRRMDADLQQQALLDGAYWRIIGRGLAGPILAAMAIVAILAMQEFVVYDATFISVVATEVRTVFETGQVGLQSGIQPGLGVALPASDLARNAAAAMVTAMPLLSIIGLLALAGLLYFRRDTSEQPLEAGPPPRILEARWKSKVLAAIVLSITTLLPLLALVLSLKRSPDLVRIWKTFSPPVLGSLLIGSLAAIVALIAAMCGTVRRMNWPIAIGLICFLVGGQLLAIAMIWIYNRPAEPWRWIYNGPAVVMMAYLARFGWLGMWAARSTWSGGWRALRDLAAVDGATRWQTARFIILPLAWPLLLASGVLVLLLSITEVPATALLKPMRPPMFIPQLLTWVHTLRDDNMIEGALLLAAIVIVLALPAILLARRNPGAMPTRAPTDHPNATAASGSGGHDSRRTHNSPMPTRATTGAADSEIARGSRGHGTGITLILFALMMLPGCGRGNQPDEVWLETGAGEGQVVYPRGIAYSKSDDKFFVVDRLARIQRLDHDGKFINGWRMPDFAQGKPVGLTVGPDNNLWVPDTHYSRIMVFTPTGQLIRQFGKNGRGKGEFIYPCNIAFDNKGRVFIAEFGDHDRIQVFDGNLNYLYEFGRFGQGDGEFSRPQSMVIAGDTLYVTDACNHRISVWRTDGVFVRNFGTIGSELGQFRYPYGLDIDSKGHLVVCEFGNNRVQLVDPASGRGLATWGQAGRETGELAYPWGVAVDRRNRVVAVDAGNNRLQVFRF